MTRVPKKVPVRKFAQKNPSRPSIPPGKLMPKGSFTCDVCNKVLSSRESLTTHQLVHFREEQRRKNFRANSKGFPCTHLDCKRIYSTSNGLHRHQAVHNGTLKKLSCESCDKKFNFSTALRLHISNYHTKIKPYVCHLCDKAFGISGNLKNHLRTHSGEMHSCMYCGVPFRSPTQLTRHISVEHASDIDSVPVEKISKDKKRKSKKHGRRARSPLPPTDALESKEEFPIHVAIKKLRKVQDRNQHLAECEILPERATRARRPPTRFAYSEIPVIKIKKVKKSGSIINKSPSKVDYKAVVTVKTNGQIPDSYYNSKEIELDLSQEYEEDENEIFGETLPLGPDDVSPIILNTFSLANAIAKEEKEDDDERDMKFMRQAPYIFATTPSLGRGKIICTYSSGLVIEGVQCPRFT